MLLLDDSLLKSGPVIPGTTTCLGENLNCLFSEYLVDKKKQSLNSSCRLEILRLRRTLVVTTIFWYLGAK